MKKKPLTLAMVCRKGGLARSQAKSEAARRNGLRGGRPPGKTVVNGTDINGHSVQNLDDELI